MILLCQLFVWYQVRRLPLIGCVEIPISSDRPGLHDIKRGVNFCPLRINSTIARQTAPPSGHTTDHNSVSVLFEPQDDLESKYWIDHVASVSQTQAPNRNHRASLQSKVRSA